jgi:hypothetical protein
MCPFCSKCFIDQAGNIYSLDMLHPDGAYYIEGDRVSIVKNNGEVNETYVLHESTEALLELIRE